MIGNTPTNQNARHERLTNDDDKTRLQLEPAPDHGDEGPLEDEQLGPLLEAYAASPCRAPRFTASSPTPRSDCVRTLAALCNIFRPAPRATSSRSRPRNSAQRPVLKGKEPPPSCPGGPVVNYHRAAKLCCRCAKRWRFRLRLAGGLRLSVLCRTRALKIFGRCPKCCRQRLLVGRNSEGEPICVDCAHIMTCFRCANCGREGQVWYARTCISCSLVRRLSAALDDGTGRVAPKLVPLFDRLTSMPSP